MRTIIAALLITLSGSALAMADGQQFFQRGNHEWQRDSWNHHDSNDGSNGGAGGSVSAPEIDPSSAVAAFVLLAGGLIVLRSRVRQ